MTTRTDLVVSRRPRQMLLIALDRWPLDLVIKEKPGWLDLPDWINLLVWLTLMTDRHEAPGHAWYRLIDPAFSALRLCLQRKRILNITNEITVATQAVYDVGRTYQKLCPLYHPILTTLYPQIQDGYRIHFDHLDTTGLYLLLTLE